MNVAVIGSGMAGAAAAHALTERGVTVTILDVGEGLDTQRSSVIQELQSMPNPNWTSGSLEILGENKTFRGHELPKKLHFGSDYIYAGDRSFSNMLILDKGRAPLPTFARGGFSNIWGAAALPIDSCDMQDWPISHGEIQLYLKKVAHLLPLTGGEGNLEKSFPIFRDNIGHIDIGAQGLQLLSDLRKAEDALSRSGTLFGKSRLAIHTDSMDSKKSGVFPCNGCGQCFTGCVRNSIFSTLPILDELEQNGKVIYKKNLFIDKIDEKDDRVLVQSIDTRSGERIDFCFDAVFIGAGPINTTRLLMRSKGIYDDTISLKESQKFVIPLLRLTGAKTAIEEQGITQASVFFETKVPKVSDHWVHVQMVPMNRMILDASNIPGVEYAWVRRLMMPALRHVMMAWVGLHSDHSSSLDLRLRKQHNKGDVLELSLNYSKEARQVARSVSKDLFRKGGLFKTLFCYGLTRYSNPGSGTHCGASFPMRKVPKVYTDTDILGRPFGWKKIFAVDSSVLPSIPGTTLAFTMMSNAYRIATLAPIKK